MVILLVYMHQNQKKLNKIYVKKAAIEKHLINRVTREFDGNVSMDFVAAPLKAGYITEPAKNVNGELTDTLKTIKMVRLWVVKMN